MKDNISGCSVEEAMTVLGGRWRMLIISFLIERPMRFNELRRAIPNISQRMLTLELRFLEEEGFINREVFAEVPVKVEYSLTEDGKKLNGLVEMLKEVGSWLKVR
ncbi:MAG: winged helix-turn-helix transcriptional regulator [Acinetobacter calcoaceticus]|jgi:DNA-binding HxlR family transcriptional regulator|uniref:winged helix-turn-helix transcriptional regulator n=1 Tax=Acinetobacter TaxID=469 RepID=UPI0001BB4DDC|nr:MULTISPECIES: helix-turn-helix domain-containing protein [Acinetobacter]EEY78546.1 HTH-type transcriptional activator HxlR [Acinetobacter calcoaceticus RUH2202]MBI1447320.1 helix-turn-helix transcriptional regulator [Acinetobacter sp. AC1-2]MBJ9702951.1 helix-turn-helix transcriptional regulator [Acinetobacter calcoaceticus]WNY30521.1 helix-turn-helix domain-containing protein [Acinetobacter calcoaceticus]CAI3122399.1 putative HTH-type transcriptional regulator YybR [Acinetobacter calcoacet